ncbi:hypothetical protein VPH35_120369 [Triticum aestivum]
MVELATIGVSALTTVGLSWTAWKLYEREMKPSSSRTGTLKTLAAGASDPVIGRDNEIDRTICILCRRTKNCAALVGPAGVGKTAIVEGLAQRIAAGTVPDALAGARVVELDAEDTAGKLILFIDEMHMLVGAGDQGRTVDAANILKPALARGRIRCIGATTSKEYRKYIERDAALERRFQRVDVDEPSVQATVAILQGLKQRYQDHHGLIIQDDALVAAAQLAGRYIKGMHCCEVASTKKGENKKTSTINAVEEITVGPCHIAQVVGRWTKCPINTLGREEENFSHIVDKLHERVVGQYEAVNLVAQEVLRSRVGFDQSGQPIGSFLFLGPIGVGKTELAKALAEKLFDNEKMLVRFDMSEYADSGSVSRLVGGPGSYEEDGQLTEKVRSQPYSVVLFDEVDKAHPSIFKVLIQLLDDGTLIDGKGRNVYFKDTIIIMSSNLGVENLSAGTAGENIATARDLLMKQVEKRFKPEFINKLSETVIFEPLSHDELREIVKIQMKSVVAMAAKKGISLFATDAALDVIWSESHDTVYGARPIKRWMKKNVTRVLVDMLVNGEACQGSVISVNATDDKKGLKYQILK